MKNKLINILYHFSVASFILSYLIFSYSVETKGVEAQAGQSLGGRISSVLTEVCTLGVPNTACACGCTSNQCTILTPYGGAAMPIVCLPTGMMTTAAPITPASSGSLILGLFSILSQTIVSVPVGIVGTAIGG